MFKLRRTIDCRHCEFTLRAAERARGTVNPQLITPLQEHELAACGFQVKRTAARRPSLRSTGKRSLKAIKCASITTEINNTHPV